MRSRSEGPAERVINLRRNGTRVDLDLLGNPSPIAVTRVRWSVIGDRIYFGWLSPSPTTFKSIDGFVGPFLPVWNKGWNIVSVSPDAVHLCDDVGSNWYLARLPE
jgi:hypothetical protein